MTVDFDQELLISQAGALQNLTLVAVEFLLSFGVL
jgi:hypothetical protein